MKELYNKPYTAPQDLIPYLEGKELSIEDKGNAEKILKNINYYRFKVYLRPFLDIESGKFKEGSSFEKAHQLYRFDDELRDILFSIIGRIEVKIRTRLDQTITEHEGDAFWYLDSKNFSANAKDHRTALNTKFRKILRLFKAGFVFVVKRFYSFIFFRKRPLLKNNWLS